MQAHWWPWLVITLICPACMTNCIVAYERITFNFYYEIIEPRSRFKPTKLPTRQKQVGRFYHSATAICLSQGCITKIKIKQDQRNFRYQARCNIRIPRYSDQKVPRIPWVPCHPNLHSKSSPERRNKLKNFTILFHNCKYLVQYIFHEYIPVDIWALNMEVEVHCL